MAKRLLVEGLDWAVTEGQLMRVFAPFGDLDETRIAVDWETGRSRGFGYVTFRDSGDAEAAIAGLDGQKLAGKTLRVMVAPEQATRSTYRGGDYGHVEGADGKASGYRSADYDGTGRGGPGEPRTDRKIYRSADFGYVEREAKPPEPAPPEVKADARGAEAKPAPAAPGKAAAKASLASKKNAIDPEDSLEDEERVSRAKFGGWKESTDNDGGVGGGGDTFG